jgi:GNAT superfamily N-acetyltransferase
MSDYHLRIATLDDQDTLVAHRIAMFHDMGLAFDAAALADVFRPWLAAHMTAGDYRAWVIEDATGAIAAGGGMTLIAWPPGPRNHGERMAFVYNVYTEPAHRHRGLARRVMEAIHQDCRAEGIVSVALNASQFGQPLYETMGYAVATSPMMILALE